MIRLLLRIVLLLIVIVIVIFMVNDIKPGNEPEQPKRYILQTIDDDGVAWYVYMTWPDYQEWAGKRLRLK